MGDDGKRYGEERSANDNRQFTGDAGATADAAARLDAVVLSVARLIGRRMARQEFGAVQAANDNGYLAGMPEGEVDEDDNA